MLGGKFALTGRVNCEVRRPPLLYLGLLIEANSRSVAMWDTVIM